MDDALYVVQIGTEHIIAEDQEHAIDLMRLLSKGRAADDHYENGHGYVLRLKDKTTLRLDVRSRSSLEVESDESGLANNG